MTLSTAYLEAQSASATASAEWELWFDADLDQDTLETVNAHLDALEATGYPTDILESMLEAGEVMWWCPAWVRDLREVFYGWLRHGKEIKARLIADWLLSTLPPDPIDPDTAQYIALVAAGDALEAEPGLCCFWPARPQIYLDRLDLAMAEVADDALASYNADVNTRLFIDTGKAI
jgi:hypothetical protein